MIAFDPARLIPKSLAELKERELFLQRNMSKHILAIVVVAGPSEHLICHLNGEHAFHLESIKTRMSRSSVITLPSAIDKLSLRIDTDSAPNDLFVYPPGRLVTTSNDGPGIIVNRPGKQIDDEPYVLSLPQWELSQVGRPAFGFERWSLSHLDQDGSWQSLVERTPSKQSD